MNEQELERRRKLEELKKLGEDPFLVERVDCNSTIGEIVSECVAVDKTEEELTQINKSTLGRVVSLRQSFLTLRNGKWSIQAYISKKDCSEQLINYCDKYLDIGDVVCVKGNFFRTKLGEVTMRIQDLKIVSKCINPFPSLYYGIQDEELKVRNRVGRALVDETFYSTLLTRSRIIAYIRKRLGEMGYVEMETPILETVYGGANAVPFVTRCEALKENFFLRIATEISLKKAVIAGFSKVFEIGKVFRNEGIDHSHNPEFTSLEIYTVNHGLEETMNLTETLIRDTAQALDIGEIKMDNGVIDLNTSFRRLFMNDLVREKTGLDFYYGDVSLEEAKSSAKKYGIDLNEFEETTGHIFHKLFDRLVADDLFAPTFVYGFHKDVSPLSKEDPKNPNFTLRYELYIGGVEYSNGFAELNDPDAQRARFEQQQQERKLGNREAFEIDEGFLFSLQYGLPPTGGIGIGIDRLVMLLTNQHSIKDVMFIPQIKK